jgi:hypothetical protein
MAVIPFPVLTLEQIVPHDWEPMLTLPLPRNPSLDLLERTRGQVLLYLDWIMAEMVLIDDPWVVRREIGRATDRLLEIATVLPDAMDRYADRGLKSILPRHVASVTKWLAQRDDGGVLLRTLVEEGDPKTE